ncbi:amidase-domain-containing protein [Leptodontidium sp. MPI-SDFR-AT-0119]|nr:amidase-domain-containing protein [Leptodontidium sp. MPI-SDFR-AT-0119]
MITLEMEGLAATNSRLTRWPVFNAARLRTAREIGCTCNQKSHFPDCLGAVSDTSVTGPVHNPHAHGNSTGGFSSGSGRLLASNTVDLAIGADQGDSIRLPSTNCGVVGLKPTWGLVPYTGCISLQATIDRVGPMAKNAQDCATLLKVIVGTDHHNRRPPRRILRPSHRPERRHRLSRSYPQPLLPRRRNQKHLHPPPQGKRHDLDGSPPHVRDNTRSPILPFGTQTTALPRAL